MCKVAELSKAVASSCPTPGPRRRHEAVRTFSYSNSSCNSNCNSNSNCFSSSYRNKSKTAKHSKLSASRVSRLCPAYLLFSEPRSARFGNLELAQEALYFGLEARVRACLQLLYIGALMVRIGFRGPLYYNDYNYKTAMPRVSIGTGDLSRFGDEYLDNCQSLKPWSLLGNLIF